MAIGKKLAKAREGIDREHLYTLTEAVKMVKASEPLLVMKMGSIGWG